MWCENDLLQLLPLETGSFSTARARHAVQHVIREEKAGPVGLNDGRVRMLVSETIVISKLEGGCV